MATKSAAQGKTVHSTTRAYRLTHNKIAYIDMYMFTHTHMDICTSLCLLPPPSLSLLIPVYPFLPLSYRSRWPCNSGVVIVRNTPSRVLGGSAANIPVTVVYKSTDKPELSMPCTARARQLWYVLAVKAYIFILDLFAKPENRWVCSSPIMNREIS